MKEEKKVLNQLEKKECSTNLQFNDEDLEQLLRQSKLNNKSSNKEGKEHSLEVLLNQVTPENIYDEVQWGKPRGKEIW